MTEHPITSPPSELIREWIRLGGTTNLALEAARWGADQELEACCEWLADDHTPVLGQRLRAARRPKPPSLKEQALAALQRAEEGWRPIPDDCDIIRRALEALPE